MGGVHIAWFSRVPKARRVSEANELQPFVMRVLRLYRHDLVGLTLL